MENCWIIRGVSSEAIALVQAVTSAYGHTSGEIVTEAILVWYESLPKTDKEPLVREQLLTDGVNRLLD